MPSSPRNKTSTASPANNNSNKRSDKKRDVKEKKSNKTRREEEDEINNNVSDDESQSDGGSVSGGAEKQDKNKNNKDSERQNKIYKAPPTPPHQRLQKREKGFILDCVAVDTMSRGYSLIRPKLGQVISPYIAADDPAAQSFFTSKPVQKTIQSGKQDMWDPVEGAAVAAYHTNGSGFKYLSRRNRNGGGHSEVTYGGHSQFMHDVQPVSGYNGRFGYRRTSPALRQYPSTFGTITTQPLH